MKRILKIFAWTVIVIVLGKLAMTMAYDYYLKTKSFVPEMNEYEKTFVDLQKDQLKSAKKNGIKPIDTRSELLNAVSEMLSEGKVVKLESGKYYKIQKLTHSHPYVVPEVMELLNDLGENFQAETGNASKFVVTSVLRTAEDIRNLQKTNVNSIKDSPHRYATTIDISYTSFKGKRSDGELREALAKSLQELQKDKRCYVKFEKNQHCYHITVR